MNTSTQNIDLVNGTPDEKRAEIKRYFNAIWTLYERLFDTLVSDDVFYLRPQPLRHPLVFYFGHTATFFVNKLLLAKIFESRINTPSRK